MRAVSNTSPISNLASIGRLALLKRQFSKIVIPSAVLDELRHHPDPSALAAIQQGIQEGWIGSTMVASSAALDILLAQLHRGEAEAITLAGHMKADILLIDEQEGRQFASQIGLAITGVLGVLLRAKRSGDITSLRDEIHALRTLANFFIAPALEAKVLAAAGE